MNLYNGKVITLSTVSIVYIMLYTSQVQMLELSLEQRIKMMQNDVFDQVVQTSIEEQILASLPEMEIKSHLKRDSRSRRVLRSIQDSGCKNAFDDSTCRYLRFNGECKAKNNEMKLYCPETCGFCFKGPRRCLLSKYGCCADGVTIAKGPNFRGCPETCKDDRIGKYCKIVRRLSMCQTKGIMDACEKTCGYCRPCEDSSKYKCYYAAKYGSCGTLRTTMMNDCRRSCNFCGPKDPCHNHPCPRHSTCIVDAKGNATCICNKKCHKGDHHTGPVCGRNGITYKNLCALKKNVCHRYHHITVRKYGKCNHGIRALRAVHCKKANTDHKDCKVWKLSGFCESKDKHMSKLCPYTCNFCVNQYPQTACHYSKYGCCLDNVTECKGEGYQGCPDRKKYCKDKSKILCRRFVALCGYKRHAEFLKSYCPKTCMFC